MNYSIIILVYSNLNNQVSGFFDQIYLKNKCTCSILTFFFMQINRWTIKKQTDNLLMLDPKSRKNWPRNEKSQVSKKPHHSLLVVFDFRIMWISIRRSLLALTLRLRWPKFCIFDVQFCPADYEFSDTFSLKFLCPW